MKTLLLGNGINIEFGGMAYSNAFILKRIKFRVKLNDYSSLFANTVAPDEIIGIFKGLVNIANDLREGKYDSLIVDADSKNAAEDFKRRYRVNVTELHEIMLEDWFFLLHVFFIINSDLSGLATTVTQGFEQIILDGIYNGGKIQELYHNMNDNVKAYLQAFDNIFTLNYDNNIEKLTRKQVYHLHGDFSVLSNSENPKNVLGYIRTSKNQTVVQKDMKHCFCNALLNYSGENKYKEAKDNHKCIEYFDKVVKDYNADSAYRLKMDNDLAEMKDTKPQEYEMIKTKLQNTELNMATEYYFDKFESIEDELSIIGMSPNNDGHIFNCILKNKHIKKVIFYYFAEEDRKYIEDNYDSSLFECRHVSELWSSLGRIHEEYYKKISMPKEIDEFIERFNLLSGDKATRVDVVNEVQRIPEFEVNRLCMLVKDEMTKRNAYSTPKSEEDLLTSFASISYVALQEGVLPSALLMICMLNIKLLSNK